MPFCSLWGLCFRRLQRRRRRSGNLWHCHRRAIPTLLFRSAKAAVKAGRVYMLSVARARLSSVAARNRQPPRLLLVPALWPPPHRWHLCSSPRRRWQDLCRKLLLAHMLPLPWVAMASLTTRAPPLVSFCSFCSLFVFFLFFFCCTSIYFASLSAHFCHFSCCLAQVDPTLKGGIDS